MAVNGDHPQTFRNLDSPPGVPSEAYVLPSLCGEIIYIPCSKSATRLIVTGKETNDAFAVVGTGGTAASPIGFHFHRQTHDVFLCLKGQVNVSAGEKCRTMGPGDFASVPPVWLPFVNPDESQAREICQLNLTLPVDGDSPISDPRGTQRVSWLDRRMAVGKSSSTSSASRIMDLYSLSVTNGTLSRS